MIPELTKDDVLNSASVLEKLAFQGFEGVPAFRKELAERLVSDYYETDNVSPSLGIRKLGLCPATEKYNRRVLSEWMPKGKGVLVFTEGEPLGYVKWLKNTTFLSMRTVKKDDTYPLISGGIYNIDTRLFENISLGVDKWGMLELPEFKVNPGRMFYNKENSSRNTFGEEFNLNNKLEQIREESKKSYRLGGTEKYQIIPLEDAVSGIR